MRESRARHAGGPDTLGGYRERNVYPVKYTTHLGMAFYLPSLSSPSPLTARISLILGPAGPTDSKPAYCLYSEIETKPK